MSLQECKKCGQPHPRCHAHKRRTDPKQPCMAWPEKMGTLCRRHGGNTQTQKKAVAQRVAAATLEADINAYLASTGQQGVHDPLGTLEKVVAQSLDLADAMGKRLNALNRIDHEDTKGGLYTKVELQAYERGLDRAMKGLDLLIQRKPNASSEAARSLLTSLAQQLGIRPAADE